MPTYRYESKTQQGKVVSGVLNAASLSAASEQIYGGGGDDLSLHPASRTTSTRTQRDMRGV